MVVVLTGFMGTGKTAVGRRVAERLGLRFIDTDALIEAREGRSIADIFAAEGEAYFRRREREVVAEVTALQNVVIATGGGTIVDEQNARRLREAGVVVCLTANPDVILERTRGHARPLLQHGDRRQRVAALLAERAGAYAQAAYTIDTSSLSTDAVVQRILGIVAETA